jgi:hypothetical protein
VLLSVVSLVCQACLACLACRCHVISGFGFLACLLWGFRPIIQLCATGELIRLPDQLGEVIGVFTSYLDGGMEVWKSKLIELSLMIGLLCRERERERERERQDKDGWPDGLIAADSSNPCLPGLHAGLGHGARVL